MKQIWVIDDDPGILEVIQIILEEQGYKTTLIDNFKLVKKRVNQNVPNLILLDILMSGYDGREIAKFFKSHKKTKDVPIIMISADHKVEEKAKEAGVDDILKKPFNIEDLVKIVKKYIN